MTKKTLDTSGIAQDLEGAVAAFANSGARPMKKKPEKPIATLPPTASSSQVNIEAELENKQESMSERMQACLHEIESQIDDLQRSGTQSLSVRVTPDDFKWLRRITNSFNEELEKKFNQGLFIRIGFKFLQLLEKYDSEGLTRLLKEIK